MVSDLPPYEDTLTLEELKREARRCWDLQRALVDAIRNVPEMPPPWVLLFLSRGSKWPDDSNLGKLLQRKLKGEVIPFKSECETGAGVWYRIRQGLLAPRPETLP